jgi:hypothetical protein
MADREIFGHWGLTEGELAEGRLLIEASGKIDFQVRAPLGRRTASSVG